MYIHVTYNHAWMQVLIRFQKFLEKITNHWIMSAMGKLHYHR